MAEVKNCGLSERTRVKNCKKQGTLPLINTDDTDVGPKSSKPLKRSGTEEAEEKVTECGSAIFYSSESPSMVLRTFFKSVAQSCRSASSALISGKFFALLRVSVVGVLCDGFQHVRGCGVVAKSFAHVDEQIFVAGGKHKAASKLQWIFSQAMLFVSCGLCPFAGRQIVFAQQVKEGGLTQPDSLIGFAFVIDEKRELDSGFLAEELGVAGIAQSNRGKACASFFELGFKFAQLRDVLAAKDSTVMPKKDHYGRPRLPQRSETSRLAVDVRECYSSQLAAERFAHAGHSLAQTAGCQAAFLPDVTG